MLRNNSSSPPPDPERLHVPDNLAGLLKFEQNFNKGIFEGLYGELDRMGQLSQDNPRLRSYHETYTEDGPRRIYVAASIYAKLGRTVHFMVNDETSTLDDGRVIFVREFVVPRRDRLIACTRSAHILGHHDAGTNPSPETGPVLYKGDNGLHISHGQKYVTKMPKRVRRRDLSRILQSSDLVQELLRITRSLDTVSLEPDIKLVD